jgi:hypothetical protein
VGIGSIPAFEDYSGPPNHREAGIEYFVNKFLERNSVHQEVPLFPSPLLSFLFSLASPVALFPYPLIPLLLSFPCLLSSVLLSSL